AGLDDADMRRQNVGELLAAASAFDAEPNTGGLRDFLERVALVNDRDRGAAPAASHQRALARNVRPARRRHAVPLFARDRPGNLASYRARAKTAGDFAPTLAR